MKHIRQKPYECFPTVLAMLTGRKVSNVKRELQGQDLASESWSYLISNGHSQKFAKLRFRVELVLAKRLPWLSVESFQTTDPLGLDPRVFELPIGRGVLVVGSHIVAFEDGHVFDPNASKPIAWVEYRAGLVRRNKSINLVEREP